MATITPPATLVPAAGATAPAPEADHESLPRRMSLQHELFGAWCAPIFTVLTIVGFLGLSRFYHPVAGNVPDRVLAGFYASHRFGVELGMSIFALATVFLAIYTIELSIALWRREGTTPLFAIGQLLGGFAVVMLIFISCCLWIGAAYRAGQAGSDVTAALNDTSWFGFLVGWVMLSLQMACAGVIVIRSHAHSRHPLAPRWVGWATILGAIVLATANGCAFTKGGTFGWNGVLGYYLPMAIWGVWLDGMAFLLRADVKRRIAAAETQYRA